MRSFMFVQSIKSFVKNEDGATAIEYGMIAAMVAVGALVAFTTFGAGLTNLFGSNAAGAGGVVENAASQL